MSNDPEHWMELAVSHQRTALQVVRMSFEGAIVLLHEAALAAMNALALRHERAPITSRNLLEEHDRFVGTGVIEASPLLREAVRRLNRNVHRVRLPCMPREVVQMPELNDRVEASIDDADRIINAVRTATDPRAKQKTTAPFRLMAVPTPPEA